MAIPYERHRHGLPTGWIEWVDEPADVTGDTAQDHQRRSTLAQIHQRMAVSRRWQRIDPEEHASRWALNGPDGRVKQELTPPAGKEPAKAERKSEGKGGALPTQADVRAWAKREGIEVSDQGRVPNALIEQYIQAHGG